MDSASLWDIVQLRRAKVRVEMGVEIKGESGRKGWGGGLE